MRRKGVVLVTAASMQDRDAARPLLWNLRRAFPSIRLAWADGGYAGKLVTWAKTRLRLTLEIVKRPDDLHTFKVLPRRWVVERTLSWITRHRRTVRDYERLPAHHETYVYWAMIIVMTRRLARQPPPLSHMPPEFSSRLLGRSDESVQVKAADVDTVAAPVDARVWGERCDVIAVGAVAKPSIRGKGSVKGRDPEDPCIASAVTGVAEQFWTTRTLGPEGDSRAACTVAGTRPDGLRPGLARR